MHINICSILAVFLVFAGNAIRNMDYAIEGNVTFFTKTRYFAVLKRDKRSAPIKFYNNHFALLLLTYLIRPH